MRSGRSLKKLSEIQAMRDLCLRKQQELSDKNSPLSTREEIRGIMLVDKVNLLDWVLGFETTEK